MTLEQILKAKTLADLIDTKLNDDAFLREYTKLLRLTHPDMNPHDSSKATDAFVHLQALKARKVIPGQHITVKTKRNTYLIGEDRWKSSGVRYRSIVGDDQSWLAYVSIQKATGSFVSGYRNLKEIRTKAKDEDREHFFPLIKDSLRFGENELKEARVITADVPGTRWFGVDDFKLISPRDIGWISRRVFIALDLTHKAGYLHGSPGLDSLLIEPVQHGIMLKDWQYSVKMGEPLSLIDSKAAKYYPTWAKDSGSTKDGKLDIIIAAAGLKELALASKSPDWLIKFFDYLVKYTPKTANIALGELTEALDDHWPREFHPMAYPAS